MLTEANQRPGCTGSWPQHYYRIWRQSHTLGRGGGTCTEKCTCLHCHIRQGGETASPYVQSISFHSSHLDVRESWNLYEMSSRSHLQPTQFNKSHHFLSIDNNRNLENWSRDNHPWSGDKKPAKGILPQCTTLKLQTRSTSGQNWQLCQASHALSPDFWSLYCRRQSWQSFSFSQHLSGFAVSVYVCIVHILHTCTDMCLWTLWTLHKEIF